MKIIQWLLTFNPFVLTNSNLRYLQSGLSSSKEKDGVNCEDAETIGANIQAKLDNKAINVSFKKSNCYYSGVHFDHLRLFSRLISIAEWTNKFKEYFEYKLAH